MKRTKWNNKNLLNLIINQLNFEAIIKRSAEIIFSFKWQILLLSIRRNTSCNYLWFYDSCWGSLYLSKWEIMVYGSYHLPEGQLYKPFLSIHRISLGQSGFDQRSGTTRWYVEWWVYYRDLILCNSGNEIFCRLPCLVLKVHRPGIEEEKIMYRRKDKLEPQGFSLL